MEAAFALMIKNGVDAVSTGDITKALGLSRSLPYRYFSTKRELVYETFKLYFCDRFFPDPGAPAPSTLYEAVRLVADRLSEIMSSLGKSVGGRIDVFDYNALYIEALKREPEVQKVRCLPVIEIFRMRRPRHRFRRGSDRCPQTL